MSVKTEEKQSVILALEDVNREFKRVEKLSVAEGDNEEIYYELSKDSLKDLIRDQLTWFSENQDSYLNNYELLFEGYKFILNLEQIDSLITNVIEELCVNLVDTFIADDKRPSLTIRNCKISNVTLNKEWNIGKRSCSFKFANCKIGSFLLLADTFTPLICPSVDIGEETFIDRFVIEWDKSSFLHVPISFSNSIIKNIYANKNISIYNGRYNAPLTFCECELGTKDVATDIDFIKVKFEAMLIFDKCIFWSAPKFYEATLFEDTDFKNCRFEDIKTSEAAWRRYRTLRHHMDDINSDYLVQKFHALELEAKYYTGIPEKTELFFSFMLRIFNNYGQVLYRPFAWLLVIGAIFYISYYYSGGVGCIKGQIFTGWIESICESSVNEFFSSRNLAYTASNTFGPMGIAMGSDAILPNSQVVKALGLFQSLLSTVIWFVWILQIRARFKL